MTPLVRYRSPGRLSMEGFVRSSASTRPGWRSSGGPAGPKASPAEAGTPYLIAHVVLLAAALLGSSCRDPSVIAPEVVARVGDAVITKEYLQAELKRRASNGQSVAGAGGPTAVLDDLIRLETLFANAKAAGYDRDPELAQQFKRMVASKFEDEERKKGPALRKPEPGEVKLFYDSHQDQFTSPEKVRVAAIFQRVSAKAGAAQEDQVKSAMEALRGRAVAEAADQPDFGLLAQDNSDDQATRYRGGDCGFLTRMSSKVRWDHSVRDAAFVLRTKGDISPLIRAPDGFYLLKLIERLPPETASLEQVRDRIERQLFAAEQKRANEQFETAQRRRQKIEINQPLLQSIEAPQALARTESSMPSAMPAP